ncbi:MAG: DUF6265 family protein [Acidobacteriota bacterium]
MKRLTVLLAAIAALGLAETRPAATLKDVAWLEGKWSGTGLGGQAEDLWSSPAAGAMPGIFRLVKDGKVVFYELMTLVETEGSLELRLKHFHPDLKGWEEKDTVLSFPLTARDVNKLQFGGIVFERSVDDELTVTVTIRQRDGTTKDEPFRFKRER